MRFDEFENLEGAACSGFEELEIGGYDTICLALVPVTFLKL